MLVQSKNIWMVPDRSLAGFLAVRSICQSTCPVRFETWSVKDPNTAYAVTFFFKFSVTCFASQFSLPSLHLLRAIFPNPSCAHADKEFMELWTCWGCAPCLSPHLFDELARKLEATHCCLSRSSSCSPTFHCLTDLDATAATSLSICELWLTLKTHRSRSLPRWQWRAVPASQPKWALYLGCQTLAFSEMSEVVILPVVL
jgi:hypothetical protein